eukprot:CAMPEP_0184520446 /NCGR_PEP_ID=MMETSP0198_2-20121128/7168_1 /TAXON_ID=1112570 /ORGANISM="Thraustochytrium sp., Strain LLF1b" /LENGTH=156 /DNA_ID=CAMNT_0026911037 /DNA_START=38 /DNA_END=508 /DNA_ORIENTATION=-
MTGADRMIRLARYEVFWTSHHSFILFYGMLYIHAHIPLALYVGERFYKMFKESKPFHVVKVEYQHPVLCIGFRPKHEGSFVYKEGQYLYLKVPTVSKTQRHPFTISSAYEDLAREDGIATVHIRVQGVGSWTHKVCEKFRDMVPLSQSTGPTVTFP